MPLELRGSTARTGVSPRMVQQQSEVNRRLNLLLQHDPILNSFAMNHPEEAIRLAMRPITDDEFQDVAFQMMTQGEIDTTLNQLVGMDPDARALSGLGDGSP